MTDQMTGSTVRRSVTVDVPVDRAFDVFTRDFIAWWPPSHYIGAEQPVAIVLEPRAGGRWFERAADGTECDWGRVLVWEPPNRVVLTWQLTADWTYDSNFETEVEVRFGDIGDGRTSVDLEHRLLERYGEREQDMRDTFDSPRGWPGILERYAQTVEEGSDRSGK